MVTPLRRQNGVVVVRHDLRQFEPSKKLTVLPESENLRDDDAERITICVEEEAATIRSVVAHLLLESEDVGDATVDGVLQPGSSLVGDGERRLGPVGD
ncbi:hypothetical protein BHE74_00029675 [Ensete ventricosum]|nr:hypothetical protein BHE74_00029675 [Ensete ventricosum]